MAREVLKELYVLLGFEGDSKELDKFAHSMNGIIGVVKGFIAFKAAEKIGRELAGIALGAADNAVRLEQSAMSLRYNTQEIQALEYAAGSANVPVQAVIDGLTQLRNLQAQAATGDAGAVGILGFGGAPGKDAVETMAKIADRVQGMSAGMQRLYLQRSGLSSLLPLFNMGGEFIRQMAQEAKDLGYTLDEASVKGGSKMNSQLFKLDARLEVLKNRTAKELIPLGLKITEVLLKLWQRYEKFLTLENLTQMLKRLTAQLEMLGIVLASIAVVGTLITLFTQWNYVVLTVITTLMKAQAAMVALMGSTLASILIWGLLAAAMVLVIDDLYAFANGGKSLLGTLYILNPTLRKFTDFWGDAQEGISKTGDALDAALEKMKELMPFLSPLIDGLRDLLGVKDDSTEKQLGALDTKIKMAQHMQQEAESKGDFGAVKMWENREKQFITQKIAARNAEAEDARARAQYGKGPALEAPWRGAALGAVQMSAPQSSQMSVNGGTYTVNQNFTGTAVSPQGAGQAVNGALKTAQERDYRQAATAAAGAVR